MPKVLLVDNYDSFTYNLAHYLEAFDADVTVWRNDEFSLDEADAFHKIVLSPGPGLPKEHSQLLELINRYAATKSILGICLGQQAIAEAFGGKLKNLDNVFHGISGKIEVVDSSEKLFYGLEIHQTVGRYHSWIVDEKLPEVLVPTSVGENGEIMSLRHKTLDVRGVQFHPESIMTPHGKMMISNWLSI
ncbi:anthranilate synthase component II [Flavobacterium silvaticum]|uniref:Aminodeoxychorismate/anthranilate synthase component II n=1 Tax=Flavobacterium silvaticum TaxID=1852020 RepID=A0A972FLL4_9FLAO|nr:aminodeoxychorismate/anthranilate synthase component II [Flavobacterium silvaticum]NMH27978.1 aminodeoxychorismate/anthranilate synthase component II [Flavobacterium silvaticum]